MNRDKLVIFFKSGFLGRKLFLWFILAVALLIAVFGMQFIITENLKRATALKQQILITQKTLDNFSDLKLQKQKAAVFQQRLANILPSKENLIPALSGLEEQAGVLGLQQSFSFGAESDGSRQELRHIGFSLTVNGSLGQFIQYLKEVESLPLFIRFGAIEIAEKSPDQYQINTTGKVYLR